MAAALQKMSTPVFELLASWFNAFHQDAAAVASTHAALWFLGKQMGAMQTVYHDRLQMSFCGQCTLLWKWFGQWKREEKYNKDKKGKWVSLGPFCSFFSFLGPSVVCNRRDENWFPGELFRVTLSLGETMISPLPLFQTVPSRVLQRRTALIVHFNILDGFRDSFTSSLPAQRWALPVC